MEKNKKGLNKSWVYGNGVIIAVTKYLHGTVFVPGDPLSIMNIVMQDFYL